MATIDPEVELRYQVEDLGIVAGFDQATAMAIGLDGDTVGILGPPDSDATAGFIWTSFDHRMTQLEVVRTGLGGTEGLAINDLSMIVGRSKGRLTVWGRNAVVQRVTYDASTFANAFAHGVSFRGKIVGGYFPGAGMAAAVWDEDGRRVLRLDYEGVEIGHPAHFAEALAVNSSVPQKAVGTIRPYDLGIEHAAWWDLSRSEPNMATDLTPGSTAPSAVRAVNDFGVMAGFHGNHAVVWSRDGRTEHAIAVPSGYRSSRANGINEHGVIVGEMWRMPDREGQPVAVKAAHDWREPWINLNTCIDPTSGWALASATAINKQGQVVGWGLHDGQHRAYQLTPIRPSEPPHIRP
ncbi:MAG: hypothetical protein U0Z70_06800 [Thermomicrobiales bacterium]